MYCWHSTLYNMRASISYIKWQCIKYKITHLICSCSIKQTNDGSFQLCILFYISYTVFSKEIIEAVWKPMPLPTFNQIIIFFYIGHFRNFDRFDWQQLYIIWCQSSNHRHFNSLTSDTAEIYMGVMCKMLQPHRLYQQVENMTTQATQKLYD